MIYLCELNYSPPSLLLPSSLRSLSLCNPKTVATTRSLKKNRHSESVLEEHAFGVKETEREREREMLISARVIYHAWTIARINLPGQNCDLYERCIAKYKHHKFTNRSTKETEAGREMGHEKERERERKIIPKRWSILRARGQPIIETIYLVKRDLGEVKRGEFNLIDSCIFISGRSCDSPDHLIVTYLLVNGPTRSLRGELVSQVQVFSVFSFSSARRLTQGAEVACSLTKTEKARLLNRTHEKWRFRVTSAAGQG